jgi:hypothetical protein
MGNGYYKYLMVTEKFTFKMENFFKDNLGKDDLKGSDAIFFQMVIITKELLKIIVLKEKENINLIV